MVCSEERGEKFPFDIGHRKIIRFRPQSPSQFTKLRKEIVAALKAIDTQKLAIQEIQESPISRDRHGLSHHERIVLVTIAGRFSADTPGVHEEVIKSECSRAGLTNLAVALGLQKLRRKKLVEGYELQSWGSDPYTGQGLTEEGWDWLIANEKDFILQKPRASVEPDDEPPDDVPF